MAGTAATGVVSEHAALITAAVMELLKLKELDPGQPFQNYGLDSISATMLAMRRAVEGLRLKPVKVLVDGNRLPPLDVLAEAIVGGDAKVKSISAASIVAKVTRDRLLTELHEQFPQYGFAAHKGYGTPEHLQALRSHGPCIHHRRSFSPVAISWSEREGVPGVGQFVGVGGTAISVQAP